MRPGCRRVAHRIGTGHPGRRDEQQACRGSARPVLDQRRWIYTSAKGINNDFGFGSDEDLDATPGHIIIDQSIFPPAWPATPPA